MSKKKKKEVIKAEDTVASDFRNGITNLRFLAKKHGKTFNQVAAYLRK